MRYILPYCLFFLAVFNTLAQGIILEDFASGVVRPVDIQNAGDDRLFVLEHRGTIKIVNADGSLDNGIYLNIIDEVLNDGEQGMIGLAFHPDYQENGHFFVFYTAMDGSSQLSRFTVSQNDPNRADASSEVKMINVPQPYETHTGGSLNFGPDGYLYISVGDGGSAGDPGNRGQNTESILGTLLRIDVDNGDPYAIPEGNPFVGTDGIDEIWAFGLRNVWKFSIDPETGDIWTADVGQNIYEEINKVNVSEAGVNYGWRCYEGFEEYNTEENCPENGDYTFPVAVYPHAGAALFRCSVTGGYVYRGKKYPDLVGKYIFGDFCSDELGWLTADGTDDYKLTFSPPNPGNNLSSFGVDNDGEIYAAGITSGKILQVVYDENLSVDHQAMPMRLSLINHRSASSFSIEGLNDKSASVELYSISGKKVSEAQSFNSTSRFDTSALNKGIYLVRVSLSNGEIQTFKTVIR